LLFLKWSIGDRDFIHATFDLNGKQSQNGAMEYQSKTILFREKLLPQELIRDCRPNFTPSPPANFPVEHFRRKLLLILRQMQGNCLQSERQFRETRMTEGAKSQMPIHPLPSVQNSIRNGLFSVLLNPKHNKD
jgi:hypothetical protein